MWVMFAHGHCSYFIMHSIILIFNFYAFFDYDVCFDKSSTFVTTATVDGN